MDPNRPNLFQFINLSGLGSWLILLAVILILSSVGLGWLVNAFLIGLGFLIISPAILFLVLRWWLNRNIAQGNCPVCNYELAGLEKSQLQCPSCGEPLKIENGQFERLTPPGTIDVDAVDVEAKQLGE